jgi:cell division septum initiation protein DivIVA
MSGDPGDISKQQRALRATTAERLEAIVEAAERAAEGVIDDAEAQARRYLAQARADADRLAGDRTADLAELVDSLLGQASALRQEAERLQATLEAAKSRIEAPATPQSATQPTADQSQTPRLRAVRSEEAPAPEPPAEPAPAPAPEEKRADAAGARLLATQLAVQGSSREEIEQRLRNGFEIEDTDGILDAILGPED